MKVLALSGSRRKNGNTSALLREALTPFSDAGWDTELIYLGDYEIQACRGCEGCAKSSRCVINDGMTGLYPLLEESDALIAGSPTYFYNVSSDMKRFIDRCYCLTSYHRKDRSAWISALERGKPRFAGLISICEQPEREGLGLTSAAMKAAFGSLGYRIVFSQEVIHAFDPGEVSSRREVLEKAARLSLRLLRTCQLAAPDIQ